MTADYEQLLTRGLRVEQQNRDSDFDPVGFYEEKLLQEVRLEIGGRVRVVFPEGSVQGGRYDEFTVFEIGPSVILAQGGNRFPVDIDRLVKLQTIEVPGQGIAHITQIRPPRLNGMYEGNAVLEKWIG